MLHILIVLITLLMPAGTLLGSIPITLTQRQLCDYELIANGGFAPLTTFLGQNDYESVVHTMRLANGTLWPMPIMFDVDEKTAAKLADDNVLRLQTTSGEILATLEVQEIWEPNKAVECQNVFGTTDEKHPAVNYLFNTMKKYYVSGPLTIKHLPEHYDFQELRRTPAELKAEFKARGITKVVAFQTRNPMHRAHQELTIRAGQETGAHVLIHPVVGLTKPGDVDHFTRVRCYEKLLKSYPENSVTLSLLPISMRMAGPREALWHAIIRKNYGCSHFIVGRDHAGPGNDSRSILSDDSYDPFYDQYQVSEADFRGMPFYDPYAAQEMVAKYADEIGITMVPFREVVYVPSLQAYQPANEIQEGVETWNISGTQLREMLKQGKEIPTWFSPKEVIEELQHTYLPKHKQGFTVFFTGLSGSGKSTLAEALAVKLHELQHRKVTILDGDEVRTFLSSELGFSKEHRSLNIRRIGYVANHVSRSGGAVICCPIAPYEDDRQFNRKIISANASYVQVYVSTPLEECERRDVKGLYAKARQGIIPHFTGISDPYEPAENSELVIDTTRISITEGVNNIIEYLRKENLI